MKTQANIVRSSTLAVALIALSGTARADSSDFQAGPIFVLSPPSSVANPECVAISNDGSSLVLTGTNAGGYEKIVWTWDDGSYASPSWTSAPDGSLFDTRLTSVRLSSSGTPDMLAHVSGPNPGSVLYTPSSNPGAAPFHVSSATGAHTGAFDFSTDATGRRRVYGSTLADVNLDGQLDLAACVWDPSSAPGTAPTLLQVNPLSDFSVARASSSDGRVVVGTQGRVHRGASIDMTPEEFSQRACLWSDGQLVQTSNLDSYDSSSFLDVSDDGSTALCRVTNADGSSSMLAYDTLTHQARVLDSMGVCGPGGECGDFFAMSADGSVIGGSAHLADGSTEATLWRRAADGSYQAHAVSTMINNLGSTGLDGVDYWRISAVSADGLTVAGTLTLGDGSLRVFTAAVPNPGTMALLTLGGLVAARRRR